MGVPEREGGSLTVWQEMGEGVGAHEPVTTSLSGKKGPQMCEGVSGHRKDTP